MFTNISDEIKQQAQQMVDEYEHNVRKNAVYGFTKFIIDGMEERDYMGVKYKQGNFNPEDIVALAKEFIDKEAPKNE